MESFSEFRNNNPDSNFEQIVLRPEYELLPIEKAKEYFKIHLFQVLVGLVLLALAAGYFYSKNNQHPITSTKESFTTTTYELTSTTVNKKIKVYVTGAVINSAVVEVSPDSRIIDAIEKAGGATDNSDLINCDLAAFVQDGSTIYVPNKQDANKSCSKLSTNVGSSSSAVNGQINNKVNLNTSTQSEIESLPGVGPALATSIINYRKQHSFTSINDLKKVKGIGEKRFEDLKDLITT